MAPIPVEELRKRSRSKLPRPGSIPDKVLSFLREHPRDAWRAVEVAGKLRIDDTTVGSALRRLRERGLVEQMDEHWFALDDREVAQLQGARLSTRLANERWGAERPGDWPSVEQPRS